MKDGQKLMPALLYAAAVVLYSGQLSAQNPDVSPVTERTPSRSEYFSWINNTNEGATHEQTMANLEFFRWLHDEYGMVLDIYAFDAGAIDGAGIYGSTDSDVFRRNFPEGFAPLSRYAGQMGTGFGLWCGPDGFGDTHEEALKRTEMMTGLVKDDGFTLFKMDAVCGQLRPEKYGYFDSMMTQVRQAAPDFILLNHRLDLGQGTKYSTTYLLEGAETYIDVHMVNDMTAPHHRAKAMSRQLPKGLTRLTEDHGVCISSCLDFWQDELVLQAFNRSLILAPQVYGNPWLLRDDEFAELAFIHNLHRDYRDILVDAVRLPESCGPYAVSRGDGKTMFVTLRNLSWETVKYKVRLDEEVGLTDRRKVRVRQYHPYIVDKGTHGYGSEVEVEVLPFRSCLVKLTTEPERDAVLLSGIPYKVVKDRMTDEPEVLLLGEPGGNYRVKVERGGRPRSFDVTFPGSLCKNDWHGKIADMREIATPGDISSVYYATCFAADNNALEVRSLKRSGPTAIPQVQAARDAFFGQEQFVGREIWDRNLFDGDPDTGFSVSWRWSDARVRSGSSMFMLDMGSVMELDSLTLHSFDVYSISPLKCMEGVTARVSSDLAQWQEVRFRAGVDMKVDLSECGPVRYLMFGECPFRLSEVCGYKDGVMVDRGSWRASNLFHGYGQADGTHAQKVWGAEFVLDDFRDGSYLCVAVNGVHGVNGAWAGFKIDGQYTGCPDRAVSYNSNTFECGVRQSDRNYTYYLPLTPDMKGRKIEAFVMAMYKDKTDLKPEVWISNHSDLPASEKMLLKNK